MGSSFVARGFCRNGGGTALNVVQHLSGIATETSRFVDAIAGTKAKLIDWIYNNACMPAGEYWDYQLIQNYIYPRATFGEEPYASKLKAAPDEMIRMMGATRLASGPDDWRQAVREQFHKGADVIKLESRTNPDVARMFGSAWARDLPIEVPRGRRDKYPDDPKKVEQLAAKYGIENNFERLLKALNGMPRRRTASANR